jgi:hypothetical protein
MEFMGGVVDEKSRPYLCCYRNDVKGHKLVQLTVQGWRDGRLHYCLHLRLLRACWQQVAAVAIGCTAQADAPCALV